jgi:hypothetical protein
LAPLFMVGAPPEVQMPEHPRTVDLAPLCLAALRLASPQQVGVGRAVL